MLAAMDDASELTALRAATDRLQRAQRHCDVDEMDRLNHPVLTFVGPNVIEPATS